MCVLIFFTILFGTFLILITTERDIFKYIYYIYIGPHAKYLLFLSDIN